MLKKMFGKKVFSFPKPVELIQKFVDSSSTKDSIVLDFFAGSSTTGHACFLHNILNGNKNRLHFILMQLPEDLKENLRHANGNREKQVCQNAIDFCIENNLPANLSSISIERLKRSSDMIKQEYGLLSESVDLGFRVFDIDSSNMNDVYYNPTATTQSLFDTTIDNVKPDRTPLDLLFQVMLELGIELSAKIEEKTFSGKKYYVVNENDIVACFDTNITNELVTEMAKIKPLYAVFRDSSFNSDSSSINCWQIFKTYNPTMKENNLKVL